MHCCNSTTDQVKAGDKLRVYVGNYGDWRDAALTVFVSFFSTAFTTLTVGQYVKVEPVTVQNLPDPGDAGAGARAMVSDATATTFNSVVAGTGSNIVPVFSDGTDWRIG